MNDHEIIKQIDKFIYISDLEKYLEDLPEENISREVCKYIIDKGCSLLCIPEKYRDVEMCKKAMRQANLYLYKNFRDMPEKYKTREMAELALANRSAITRHILDVIPEELKTYEMCKLAVRIDGSCLVSVPNEHRSDEICEIALEQVAEANYF